MSEEIDYGLVYLKIRIDEVSFQSTLNVYSINGRSYFARESSIY